MYLFVFVFLFREFVNKRHDIAIEWGWTLHQHDGQPIAGVAKNVIHDGLGLVQFERPGGGRKVHSVFHQAALDGALGPSNLSGLEFGIESIANEALAKQDLEILAIGVELSGEQACEILGGQNVPSTGVGRQDHLSAEEAKSEPSQSIRLNGGKGQRDGSGRVQGGFLGASHPMD